MFCHELQAFRQDADGESTVTNHQYEVDQQFSVGKTLTPLQHIQKVIREIVTTERQYVKVIHARGSRLNQLRSLIGTLRHVRILDQRDSS